MKIASARFLLVLLLIILLAASSASPRLTAHANEARQQAGQLMFSAYNSPPQRMCVGDKVNIRFMLKGTSAVPVVFQGVSNAGKLTGAYQTIKPDKTTSIIFTYLSSTLTAENPGFDFLTFSIVGTDLIKDWEIRVIDCKYRIVVQAHDAVSSDLVDLKLDLLGYGELSVDNDTLGVSSEKTKYSVYFKPNMEFSHPEVRCQLEEMLEGKNEFSVRGYLGNEMLNLQFYFNDMQLQGKPKLKCKDIADNRVAEAFLKGSSVQANNYVPLAQVAIDAKGGTYPFQFGEHGTGSVQLFVNRGGE